MKKIIKRVLAVALTLLMLTGSITCLAAGINQEAANEHKGQYKNYLLLGDSAASGYRDEISSNDTAFNKAYNYSVYWRVPGSYGDIIANSIIEDKSMTAFAAPGFRTIEIRYMLEDDYAANCKDEYLFHPSQLRIYEKYGYAPGDERIRQAYKQSVADADLITLGVGGNDWGAYLGWVITDVLEEENVADIYIKKAQEIISNSDIDLSTFEDLVELVHTAGALPALVEALPDAISYGLGNFYENWDYMIQDIYELNPDVTLMVIGMSDTSLKGSYFDYPDSPAEPINSEEQSGAAAEISKAVVDFILSVGNKPMIEGAEKFGYKYVDITGATYVDSHPDAGGHELIANKVIEALPDFDISTKYEDVNPGHKNYKEIEYVLRNNLMDPTSDKTFSPDNTLTKTQLSSVLENMNLSVKVNSTFSAGEEISVLDFAVTMYRAANESNDDFFGMFKSLSFALKIVSENRDNLISGGITRGNAAAYIMKLNQM